MNRLSIFQIGDLCGGKLSGGDANMLVDKISTDSRTLKPGELFVALRGENFDGHKFVDPVVSGGAAGVIVDLAWNGKVPANTAVIRVEDTLQAYQNLAAAYRRSLPLRVLAIT
jgi:UDP-N-acetylmuramoyl-tripeptide--D-alanyl-D-alanine ligase